jgi:hypothetical protein
VLSLLACNVPIASIKAAGCDIIKMDYFNYHKKGEEHDGNTEYYGSIADD